MEIETSKSIMLGETKYNPNKKWVAIDDIKHELTQFFNDVLWDSEKQAKKLIEKLNS